mgnify:CR=1 FL=1
MHTGLHIRLRKESMEKLKRVCENCRYWVYNKRTKNNYGMGAGICGLNGAEAFCESTGCAAYAEIKI